MGDNVSIKEELINDFKNGVHNAPRELKEKWIKTLLKSKQIKETFRTVPGCYCVLGALIACQKGYRRNSKLSFTDCLDPIGCANSAAVTLNDKFGVTFAEFRKLIKESL
jgi:hypothetical protein